MKFSVLFSSGKVDNFKTSKIMVKQQKTKSAIDTIIKPRKYLFLVFIFNMITKKSARMNGFYCFNVVTLFLLWL